MKIYFTAAISLSHKYGDTYKTIINSLLDKKHDVQHEHITSIKMDDIANQKDEFRIEYYKKTLKWINNADVVVVEASFPSTIHIGHEISVALEKNKPVIVLFEKGHEPFFIRGLVSDKLFLVEYTNKNIKENLLEYIEYANKKSVIRFNMMLPSNLSNFLDEVSKDEHLPKSVIIRNLINKFKKERQSI